MPGRLSNLRVLELASVLAGPSVGQFLAELGAEVIKIENTRTRGDVTRSWVSKEEQVPPGGVSAYFSAINWGKKSLALDLSSERGQQLLHQLVAVSDIVIASYKPGDEMKLGADYGTLNAINPRIIYGQITGYGRESRKTGYDAIIQAETGFMSMNGEPGGAPLKMPVALVDVLAAHHLKEGILLALLSREQTGLGEHVHVSLYDAAVASLVNQGTNWLVAGNVPGQMGQEHPNIAPYGKTYLTADDQQIILAVGTDKQFRHLCHILGKENLGADDRFATNALRVVNREVLNDLLSHAIGLKNSVELITALNEAAVPAGIVQTVDQVLDHTTTRHMLLSGNAGSAGISGIKNVAFEASLNGPLTDLDPPPVYGQHTREILSKHLEIGPSEQGELEDLGVIQSS